MNFFIKYILLAGLSHVSCLPSSHMHGPSFLEEPPSVLEFTNSSGATLNCIGQGNPPPEIRWVDLTNKEFENTPRLRERLSNGSLYFPPFSLNDFRSEIHQSVYKCILSNVIGSIVSRECKVRAEIVSPIEVQVPNAVTIRGNVAVLKCTVPTLIRSNQFLITWVKDDPREGRSIVVSGNRVVQTNSGELHVRDVTDEDSKIRFYCQMTNKMTGERHFSQPAHIIISDPDVSQSPKIDFSSSNVQAKVGESVDLICIGQGYPPPVYKWYHKVSGLLQEIRSGAAAFVRPHQSVLQFPRVQVSDTSTYICTASNEVGEDSREMKLTIFSPLIAFIRPQKQVVDSGSQAVFNCSIQGGVGDWSLYWLKDGHRIQKSRYVDILSKGEVLVLKNVGRKDSGMYQCFAQNHEEVAQATAELILGAVSPEFEDTFAEETLQPGLAISLKCVANGNPPPRISWLLDSGQVQPSDGFFIGTFSDLKGSVVGHLNISSAKMEHGGLYTCIARNFLGTIQHSNIVNIYGPPTSRPPLNLTAVSGTNINLRCPVSGYPISSTTWFVDNEIVNEQNSKKVFSNGTLYLTHLEEEKNKGKITCNVYNQQGMMATGTIYLNIMAPPEIMPFHFSSNLKEGGITNIVCSATSGDLPITFTWRKDGKPLPHDPDIHEQHPVEMVSALRFNNLAAKHSGHYTCIATNPASSANFTAELVVRAAPTWSIEPHDTTVLYRHSAVINCQANGFPLPRITWFKAKDNKDEDFIPLESNSRLFISSNGSIEIKNAERQHEGFYNCQADNGIGTPISKTVYLKVNIPAHFRSKNFNQSGIVGHSVTLACEAEGDFPIRITWSSFANSAISSKETSTSLISELRLDRLNRQNAGIYRCTASNSFGYDHMAIHLSVKEPPEPPKDVKIIEAGSRWLKLNWTMDYAGDTNYIIQYRPMHESVWYNFTLPKSNSNYKVETLLPNTLYLLKVIAVNEIGKSKASIEVTAKTLQEVPSGYPMDITVEKVNTDSIIVRWKVLSPEFWNGELLGYRIYYAENSGTSNSRSRTIRNVDATKAAITNLKSYVTYEISIKAFNQIGEGPPSPPLTITTHESVPTSAPQNVECSPLSPESILVRWRKPYQHWNGVLQSYKLSYQPSNPKPGMRAYVEYKKTTGLEMKIHGLEKYTNYSIRVLAVTNAGEGIPSPFIQCTTAEDVPGAPDEIKALVMSSDSILVVWTSPKVPSGRIIKYNIYMQSDEEGIRKETVFEETFKRYEFRRLVENRRYEFWITASTSIGEGQSSIKVARTLSSKVPPKISCFSQTIIGVADSPLVLECTAVGLPTPTRVWRKLNEPSLPTQAKQIPNKNLMIKKLSSEDAGNYTCIAENVFGNDKISYDVIVVRVPIAPTLQLLSSTKDSVTVTWREYSDGGSPILGYVITIKSNSEEALIFIDPDKSSYTILNLKCGNKYSLLIQAINSIGRSNGSNMIHIKTQGDVPDTANENELFFVNSTCITLYLDSWPEKECPILYFSISYRVNDDWIQIGRRHVLPRPITISNLIPATLYTVKIGAYNDAGKISQSFAITTRSISGELIPVELTDQSKGWIMSQLNFIIPLISGIICLISLMVCAAILIQRRKLYHQYESGETTLNNSRVELENQQNIHRPQMHPQKNPYSPAHMIRKDSTMNLQKEDYDVYPYATFTVPNQLQTFRDCNEGNLMSENTHSLQRKRRSNSKNSTDTLNLEIACISNQQTLPIGKKSGFGTMGTSFNESDLNTAARHKKYYMKRCANMSQDSSTESAEVSPETTRRPKGRYGPTSRDCQKLPVHTTEPSDGCEINQINDNTDLLNQSSSKMSQHEKFNEELSSIVNEYRKRRIKEEEYEMIHV